MEAQGGGTEAPRSKGKEIPGIIRKMTNLERAFYRVPGLKVPLVARIEGDVSVERLRQSLERVRKKHPLVGAKVVFDDRHQAWFSNHSIPEPRVTVVDRQSESHWFEVFQDLQKKPYAPQVRPMIDYALVRSDTLSDLILLASHSICDGSAMVILLRDIMESYAHPDMQIEEVFPLQMSDYLPKHRWSVKAWLTKLYAAGANRRWRKNPHYFSQQDYEVVNDAFWANREYGSVFFELAPEDTRRLQETCHRERVSIGSAIAMAFIAAHEQLEGAFVKNERLVSIPFDLRRHATKPVGNLFSLCVGTLMLPFAYEEKRGFWENVRLLNAGVKKRTGNLNSAYLELEYFDPAFLDAFCVFAAPVLHNSRVREASGNLAAFALDGDNPAFKVVRAYEKKVPGTLASNVGIAEIPEQFGDLKLLRLAIPSIIHEHVKLLLLGITLAGRVVYTMGYLEEAGNPQKPQTTRFVHIRNRALELLGFPEKISDKAM
ncbi:MAG: hypothetical protein JXL20_08525 [Deltaproteobacteria bacterium]|nr:hypothetical protein [Deltaproteobacteria bacterium]